MDATHLAKASSVACGKKHNAPHNACQDEPATDIVFVLNKIRYDSHALHCSREPKVKNSNPFRYRQNPTMMGSCHGVNNVDT